MLLHDAVRRAKRRASRDPRGAIRNASAPALLAGNALFDQYVTVSHTGSMLQVDPKRRPTVFQVLDRIQHLLHPKGAEAQAPARASPVPRPATAARLERTDARESPKPDPREVDEASARFPSLEELDAKPKGTVKAMAANFRTQEAPLAYKPRARPDRTHAAKTETPAHTAVDMHSSDEDAPEDAEPMNLFRIRARGSGAQGSIAIDMPDASSVRGQIQNLQDAVGARPKPAQRPVRSLSELLAEESARTAGDTSLPAEPPQQEELASIEAHERALEALLGPGPTPTKEPAVGDLLGIEGLSVAAERAPAWDDDEERPAPSQPKPKPQIARKPVAPRVASPPAVEKPAVKPKPVPAMAPQRSSTWDVASKPPPPKPKPKVYVDAATSPGIDASPASRPVSPAPQAHDADALDGAPSVKTRMEQLRQSDAPKPAEKVAAVHPKPKWPPAPNGVEAERREDKAEKQGSAPAKPAEAPRNVQSPPVAAPRSTTSSPKPASEPRELAGAQKGVYVPPFEDEEEEKDVKESEVLETEDEKQAEIAAEAKETEQPKEDPKETEPEHAKDTPKETNEHVLIPLDEPTEPAEAEKPLESDPEPFEPPSEPEPKRAPSKPAPPKSVSSPSPDPSPKPSPRPSSDHSAAHAQFGAALLAQREGQRKLTKRPAQSSGVRPEKPWEKEAADAQHRQGRLVAAAFRTEPKDEEKEEESGESFAGVNALINRWQSRTM